MAKVLHPSMHPSHAEQLNQAAKFREDPQKWWSGLFQPGLDEIQFRIFVLKETYFLFAVAVESTKFNILNAGLRNIMNTDLEWATANRITKLITSWFAARILALNWSPYGINAERRWYALEMKTNSPQGLPHISHPPIASFCNMFSFPKTKLHSGYPDYILGGKADIPDFFQNVNWKSCGKGTIVRIASKM